MIEYNLISDLTFQRSESLFKYRIYIYILLLLFVNYIYILFDLRPQGNGLTAPWPRHEFPWWHLIHGSSLHSRINGRLWPFESLPSSSSPQLSLRPPNGAKVAVINHKDQQCFVIWVKTMVLMICMRLMHRTRQCFVKCIILNLKV